MLGIVDAVVIVLILAFAVFGFKNGFFKQTIFLIGTILSFILAYYCKDWLANLLSYHLPFFNFFGDIYGLTSLNILIYQLVAFFIMLGLFGLILGILLKAAKIFEGILKATIILSIPSKILGFIVGLIEGYVVVFIILFVLSSPFFHIDIINESKLRPIIVNSSPVLSNVVSKTNNTVIEIYDLASEYNKDHDKYKFNKEAISIMLENKLISKDYVITLQEKGKIDKNLARDVLNNY